MKILVVTGIFPPDIGGPASYVPTIATALSNLGHGVAVVTLADDPSARCNFPFEVIRIRRSRCWVCRWIATIGEIVRHGKSATAIVVCGLQMESALANRWIKRPLILKVVGDLVWERCSNGGMTVSIDDFQVARHPFRIRMLNRLQRWWSRDADHVIVPSRYLAGLVAGWGVKDTAIHVIYNGIPHSVSTSQVGRLPAEVLRLIVVGRLVPWKGVIAVIEALAKLDGVTVDIVGDGPQRAELESLAERLGCLSKVNFCGMMPRETAQERMAQADILVLNSSYEGLPHVAVESIRLGVPVLARRSGGTPEIVEDGVNGILLNEGTSQEIVAAVRELQADPTRLERLRTGCGQVSRRFGLDTMVEETNRLILEACESGAPGKVPAATASGLWSKLSTIKCFWDLANVIGADARSRMLLASLLPRVKWTQLQNKADLVKFSCRVNVNSMSCQISLRAQDVFILREVIYEHCYAAGWMNVGAPTLVVDLGAHIGFASLYFHSLFPLARIHAYEPTHINGELLRENVGHIPRMTIHDYAVGSQSGSTVINVTPRRLAGHSLIAPKKNNGGYQQACKVLSLDDILGDITIPQDRVLVKFDIEGVEYEVFAASRRIHDVAYIMGEAKCSPEEVAKFIALFPNHRVHKEQVSGNMFILRMIRREA